MANFVAVGWVESRSRSAGESPIEVLALVRGSSQITRLSLVRGSNDRLATMASWRDQELLHYEAIL